MARARRLPTYTKADIERFWRNVRKGDGCWEWTGDRVPKGYGRIQISGRPVRAHRLSYELSFGPISDGVLICHKCDNPPCVRPDHLFEGDESANTKDMYQKGRRQHHRWGQTHCKKGHPLTEKPNKRGERYCVTCHRAANKRWRENRALVRKA